MHAVELDHSSSTLLGPATLPVGTQRWPRGSRHIRFGGDYTPEQWPREIWLQDVELMREAGINLVSLGIFSWGLLEPREGEYDFNRLDEVMDLLATADIDVDLGTPTASPPAWFWRRYPDARPVTRDGVRLAFGSRGMASPSSPEYRHAAVSITTRLAEHYAQHPALVMWHVHNEYGAPVSESYDDYSVAAFRIWLQQRYHSLHALNRAWGTTFWGQRYGEWDEIDSPRRAASVTNPAQRLDFARFTSDALLSCYIAERDAIRLHTPTLPVTTNFMATNCPAIDYWAWSREVDIIANDHYLSAERPDNHVLLAMDADLARSLARGSPWMLMEHSTSAVNWQPRNLAKRPGELQRNSIAHFARGADAIMFFQFRASRFGAEKFHSAMVPHAGTNSRVWREVVALGDALAKLEEVRGTTVDARVAILWDWQSFWAQDLEWRPSIDLQHRERIEAHYAALWRRGIVVDFVHPSAPLQGYDLVIAPSLYLISAADAANLTDFVSRGGHVLVSYGSGLVDEHDAVHDGGFPGPLREPLGLLIEELLPLAAEEQIPLNSGGTGSIWADDIQLTTAQPVLTFAGGRAAGRPAATRNELDDGVAWYIATRLDDETFEHLLDNVLADAGIAFDRPPNGLEVIERASLDDRLRFFINHSGADITVAATGHELLTDTAKHGSLTVPAGGVRIIRATSARPHSGASPT